MAFGPLIDIPLMSAIFGVIIKYKNWLVGVFGKIKLPIFIVALLASAPFIIVEEHINCGAYNCANVFIPPTLWFIMGMILIFFGIVKLLRLKKVFWQSLLWGFLGILFEYFIGSSKGGLHQLVRIQPVIFFLLMLWVGFSYVFVIFIPLLILNKATTNA